MSSTLKPPSGDAGRRCRRTKNLDVDERSKRVEEKPESTEEKDKPEGSDDEKEDGEERDDEDDDDDQAKRMSLAADGGGAEAPGPGNPQKHRQGPITNCTRCRTSVAAMLQNEETSPKSTERTYEKLRAQMIQLMENSI